MNGSRALVALAALSALLLLAAGPRDASAVACVGTSFCCLKWNETSSEGRVSPRECSVLAADELSAPGYAVPYASPESTANFSSNSAGARSFTLLLGLTKGACRNYAMQFTCASAFRACFTGPLAGRFDDGTPAPTLQQLGLALPRLPCRYVCDRAVKQCKPELPAEATSRFPNCSATDASLGGQPSYPAAGTAYRLATPFGNITWLVPCQNYTDVPDFQSQQNVRVPPTPASCPNPLRLRDGKVSYDDTSCLRACPDRMYSRDQWLALKILETIGAFPSFLLCTCGFFTYLTMPSGRRFPGTLALPCFAGVAGISFAIMWGTLGAFHEPVWCLNKTTNGTIENNGLCAIQAMTLYFFGLSAALSWLAIIWQLFWAAIIRKRTPWWYQIIVHVGIWTPASLGLIVLCAARKLGYRTGSMWCFVNSDDNSAWEYSFFYAPVLLIIVLGALLSIPTIVRLNILFGSKQKRRLVGLYIRMSLFVLVLGSLLLWLVIFKFVVTGMEDKVADSYRDWVLCIYSGGNNCKMDTRVPYPLLVLTVLVVAFNGILVWVSFFVSPTIWKTFFFRVYYFVTCKPKMAFNMYLTDNGATSHTSGSSPSASSGSGLSGASGISRGDDDDDDDNDDPDGIGADGKAAAAGAAAAAAAADSSDSDAGRAGGNIADDASSITSSASSSEDVPAEVQRAGASGSSSGVSGKPRGGSDSDDTGELFS